MAEYTISVDLSAVAVEAGDIVNEQVFPLLAQAVRAVAQKAQENWVDGIYDAKLWSGEKDAYAASVKWKETGAFTATVWSDYKHASEIESGRPARDLKKYLDTSAKVRRSEKGRRYLIIPFRHGTPGAHAHAKPMPKDVYEIARTLRPSRVTGSGQRISGLLASDIKTRGPLMVAQNLYRWGEHLPEGHGVRLRSHHKTDQYAGMYRFNATTPGGRRYSTYLTFRVMAEGQSGWVIPPKAGLLIAQSVATNLQPLAEKAFGEAMRRSV